MRYNRDVMTREEAANRVVTECLWGEYRLNVSEILERVARNDPQFNRFVCGKIVANGSYPSGTLRALFGESGAVALLREMPASLSHIDRRRRTALANLTGEYELVPELSWQR